MDEILVMKQGKDRDMPHLINQLEKMFPKEKNFVIGQDFFPLWLNR